MTGGVVESAAARYQAQGGVVGRPVNAFRREIRFTVLAHAGDAAWYKYSATPGQIGASVIEGHLDSEQGPAVFFRLGALHPGDTVDVTLANGVTAVFRVTGVRQYLKSRFPAKTVYHTARFAGLRLITCGGAFDYATSQYLSSIVVFAFLVESLPAGHHKAAT